MSRDARYFQMVSGLSPLTAQASSLVEKRLANGVRVFILPQTTGVEGQGPGAIHLWVAAGTSEERPQEHGCAHLLEHMLFKPFVKAAKARGVGKVEEKYFANPMRADVATVVESLGGDINAFTSHDETAFYATVPGASMEATLEVLVQALREPLFEAKELQQEAQVVIEEIHQYDDDPGHQVYSDLMKLIYPRHSYGRPILGTRREVQSHSNAQLRAFYQRHYTGDRLAVVIVGPVSPKRMMKHVERLLTSFPQKSAKSLEKPPVPRSTMGIYIRRQDVQEVHAAFGWQTPPLGAAEICALDVIAIVLGGGDTSRLVCETKRKAQLVTEIYAQHEIGRQASTFSIFARTTSKHIASACSHILKQLQELMHTGISSQEFERARALLESDRVYRRETVQGQAYALAYEALADNEMAREQHYFAYLHQLEPHDIQRVCQEFLTPARVGISLVVPEEEWTVVRSQQLRQRLRREWTGTSAKPRGKPRSIGKIDRFGITHVKLSCGLDIVAKVDTSISIGAGWLVWEGGLRAEPKSLAGASSLVASLLTRGNRPHSGDELNRQLDSMAASLDGFCGRNSIGLCFESLSRHFPQVLLHTLECALTPQFPPQELAEERRVAMQDLLADMDDPGQEATQNLLKALYGDHPFSRSLYGNKTSLRTLSRPKLQALWQNYPIAQAKLGLAGDFDLAEVVAVLEERLGEIKKWPAKQRLAQKERKYQPPSWPQKPIERISYQTRKQAHLAIGFPGLCIADRREAVLEVLLTILGSQSGRLFASLRERQGLVYQVGASSTEGLDAGHIYIYASTRQSTLKQARTAIEQELRQIRQVPTNDEELARAKAWLIGQYEVGQQKRHRLASQLALAAAYHLPLRYFFAYPAMVRQVTARQVQRLAQELFDPNKQVTSIVRAKPR